MSEEQTETLLHRIRTQRGPAIRAALQQPFELSWSTGTTHGIAFVNADLTSGNYFLNATVRNAILTQLDEIKLDTGGRKARIAFGPGVLGAFSGRPPHAGDFLSCADFVASGGQWTRQDSVEPHFVPPWWKWPIHFKPWPFPEIWFPPRSTPLTDGDRIYYV